ncbi:ATP-grasp domain-containing protein [Auritidibacter sp. NML130574]|uniref:acetyl-CoA carboxylase family protein n=1 Tax=Auritidibacter sp. NML130574 TaxID=2170745 RepID=UPI000D73AC45|nr:carboxyl transferase domain-containing protein [Auritidibacter sp. NML130574]AXR74136.1 ATP-grasp domain-containing protein [Auritidibacter sp. NML130574]
MPTVLVANRGEIAVRIVEAIHAVGMSAAVVYTADDQAHIRHADVAVELNGTGVGPYLDIDQVIAAAQSVQASYLHPGYGFLSENPELARAAQQAGIVFVGPDAHVLEVFGDKARSRQLAVSVGGPVVPATGLNPDLPQAQEFLAEHGTVMIKALAGGGGRGLRRVSDPAQLESLMRECAREAQQFFGAADVLIEKFVADPRHVEVQVIGDGHHVQQLGERDCSVQRRHQKIVEIAPSPHLSEQLRERLTAVARRIAEAVQLRSLATVEFLVTGQGPDDDLYFMEVNPRLQVEHTVTEEITGVDLVAAQLHLAAGASLTELGLDQPPVSRGYAIQARVNAEVLEADGTVTPTAGTVEHLSLPAGRYVRVDTALRAPAVINPRFDSLIAKVIGRSETFAGAAQVTARALQDLSTAPVDTNRGLLHAILTDEQFLSGAITTGYLQARLPQLREHPPVGQLDDQLQDVSARRAALPHQVTAESRRAVPEGAQPISTQVTGVVISVEATPGERVPAGTTVATVEAMKMEHPVRARTECVVQGVLVEVGDTVEAGQPLAYGQSMSDHNAVSSESSDPDRPAGSDRTSSTNLEEWQPELDELARRGEFAHQHGGTAKVERQHAAGKLTARERIAQLADEGSFAEIGALTGFGEYDDQGRLIRVKPTNYLSGTASIAGRRVLLGVDDFTIRGGSGDAAIYDKQIFTEQLAGEMRVPMVRVLDGASGGGSVTKVLDAQAMYLPVNPAWNHVVDNLSRVPVVSVCAGPTVGLGAARFVMSHFGVMIEGIGQLFTAGPPVVKAATGEDLSKEELGGATVHRGNGTVERIVADEQAAYRLVREFLSYLPSSVDEIPEAIATDDPVDRADEALVSAIPRNERQIYAIEPIVEGIFDRGSVFRFAEYGAGTYTALARLDGHPVGVITANPAHGATLSREGAMAVERLVNLCEAFHVPLVSLTDQAGMTIGSRAERDATIRLGARAISAIYQAKIPQAEIILRRVYGVGGAGIVNRHRAVRSWAWPSGDWGSLPSQGGIEAAFRSELATHPHPGQRLAEITEQLQRYSSRFRTAETFSVQDIIDPRTTRRRLCEWIHDAYRVLPRLLGAPCFGVRP